MPESWDSYFMPYKDPAKEKARKAIFREKYREALRCKGKEYSKLKRANMSAEDRIKKSLWDKTHRLKHKDAIQARKAEEYRADLAANRERSRLRSIEYRRLHPEAKRRSACRYAKRKRQSDPAYRLRDNCRRRIRKVMLLAGLRVSDRTHELLGCSPTHFRRHIEKQFQSGMSWDNYGHGIGKWEVDHEIPLAAFDLSDTEQRFAAFNYRNCQPLWFEHNIKKRDKFNMDIPTQPQ